jgi:predicted signal transduction protein with EAL and GGDEF domain
MRLFRQGFGAAGFVKVAWTFLAAVVTGSTIWCTHFIAMLAYQNGAPVAYDPVLTIVSLILAVGGANAGMLIAMLDRPRAAPILGGAVLGLAIAAMHYTGMYAYHVSGIVRWRFDMVAASVALAIGLGALALAAMRGQMGPRLIRGGTPLLIAAVLALHFTGMAALQVIPLLHGAHAFDRSAMALAVACATLGLLIIIAGGFISYIDLRTRGDVRARLNAVALTDPLTDLPNLAGFEAELPELLKRAGPGDCLMLATIRLDNLGAIIECHGSRTADLVVRAVVARLAEAQKPGVFLARTGRAELMGIGRAPDPQDLRAHVHQIAAVLAQPVFVELSPIRVVPRIGIACYPTDATDPENLMGRSRLALQRALADPLETVGIYEELQDTAARRRQILSEHLRGALARDEFELFYQPQVWIENRQIIGQEALLRWRHPQLGMISPVEFIPLAEKTGDILAIGNWALQTACADAVLWPHQWRVAVNVSPLQLRQADLPLRVHEALMQSGLSPDRLEIELTESLLLDDRIRALHVLRGIRALGVRLALDDFGTGYSSLDVLRHFPFDKIKLDKSFVDDILSNPQSQAILHAILAMGRSLDIPILAEGVETEMQLAFLRSVGCNKVQGFLTGRPVPATEVGDRAIDWTTRLARRA